MKEEEKKLIIAIVAVVVIIGIIIGSIYFINQKLGGNNGPKWQNGPGFGGERNNTTPPENRGEMPQQGEALGQAPEN